MKRTLLTVISVFLILASVFGVFAADTGTEDINSILRNKHIQHQDISDAIDLISDQVAELKKQEAQRLEDEKKVAEGVVTDVEGTKQLSEGQAQYDAGAAEFAKGQAKYNAGKSEYDKALALYNQKVAEYNEAQNVLANGQNQLNAAKQERDAGQAKLDAATAGYNAIRTIGFFSGKAADALAQSYGYPDAATVVNEYETGQAQLNEANILIAAAEEQIRDGKAQIAEAEIQLENGKQQLIAAEAELRRGEQELENAKKQLSDARGQLSEGKRTIDKNSEETAQALDKLKDYDDAQQIVEEGVAILLENEDIAARVSDKKDYEAVLDAARQFIEDDSDKVSAELDSRKELCSLLRILSFVGVAAGMMCLIGAFRPGLGKLLIAAVSSTVTALGAVAITVMAFMNGCQEYVFALPDGKGTGSMQTYAMLLLLVVAAVCAVLAVMCYKSYRSGLEAAGAAADLRYSDDFERGEEPEDDLDEEPGQAAPPEYETPVRRLGKMVRMTGDFDEELEDEYIIKTAPLYQEPSKRFGRKNRPAEEPDEELEDEYIAPEPVYPPEDVYDEYAEYDAEYEDGEENVGSAKKERPSRSSYDASAPLDAAGFAAQAKKTGRKKRREIDDDEYSDAFKGEIPVPEEPEATPEPSPEPAPEPEPAPAPEPSPEPEPAPAPELRLDYEAARKAYEDARRRYEDARKRLKK